MSRRVELAQARGRLVYLDFWASWCAPCKRSFPWMNELQRRYAAQGLQIIAVNVDAHAEDAYRFLRAMPAQFTVAFDERGDTPRDYRIQGMPTSMLISPQGRVLYVQRGFHVEDEASMENRIRTALAQGAGASPP
ncbi:MAG: TlpA family protein disulfide reductase [Burkholderiales bacterium]|nr:TlpA family protein disulfide reductase [Burkholderiales bacterium]MDE1926146.1 TlpA family protein disulfide reductase [Burkholderiales bacterium]MDE2159757.1 TlpA family protein disulfide reductase [Burkholderiales bacterium]MDE2502930.1 TlpA family protein disulfide reductase [Burkholderiales bacterium]